MADENTTDTATSDQTTDLKTDQSADQATDSTTSTQTDDTTILGAEGDKVKEKGEDAKTDAEPNAFLGAPEGEYTIDVAALPEGTTIDKDALAILTPIAKEIGLSDVAVSKLAGAYAQILPNIAKQFSASVEADAAAQRKTWADETRTAVTDAKDAKGEPVYGGKTLDEVRAISAKALDRFGGPELRPYLEQTGLGNYEPLVRAFFAAGMAIKEDSFERGGAESAPKTRSEKYYGSTKGE